MSRWKSGETDGGNVKKLIGLAVVATLVWGYVALVQSVGEVINHQHTEAVK